MAKFGAQPQRTTSTFEPPPGMMRILDPAIAAGLRFANNPPQIPFSSSIAGMTPDQIAAQRMLLGTIPGQQQLTNNALTANKFLLKDVLDPNTNPAFQATIDASVRPIYQNLAETVLPTIRGSSITNNAYGGSRQGIAEGLASGRASQAAGDTAAKVASAGYGQGLNAMLSSLQLAPTTLNAMRQPGLTQAAVGQQNQAFNQSVLNDQIFRRMYAQLAPWLAWQDVARLGLSIPGGTTVNTAPGPQQNPWSTILGLGSLGLGLFSGNPFMALGGAGQTLNNMNYSGLT